VKILHRKKGVEKDQSSLLYKELRRNLNQINGIFDLFGTSFAPLPSDLSLVLNSIADNWKYCLRSIGLMFCFNHQFC
jgi:hypothetical protein